MTSRPPAIVLVAALVIGSLALAQCGLVDDPGTGEEGGDGETGGMIPGSDGFEPPGRVKWVLGSETESVLTSPVMDEAGILYTVVKPRVLPDKVELAIDSGPLRVVALESDGSEKWRSETLCSFPGSLPVSGLPSLSIAVRGRHIYATCNDAVTQFDPSGAINFTIVGLVSHGLTIAADGKIAGFVPGEPYTLRAVSLNERLDWTLKLGGELSRSDPATETRFSPLATPVIADGLLYAPCDACVASPDDGTVQMGVALVDWQTGEAEQVILDERRELDVVEDFVPLAGAPQGGVYYLNQELHFYDPVGGQQHLQESAAAGTVLVGKQGPVYADGRRGVVHWGREGNVVVSAEAIAFDEVSALLEPEIVLMNSGQGVNKQGEVVFELENANLREHFVLPLDGHIVYVTENQLLVSKTVEEVRGFEVGAPWPSPAGNAQGNRRVD